jgi:hypothetical protein
MKVICIDGVRAGIIGERKIIIASKLDEIYEGEIYTVCGRAAVNGKLGYFLSERLRHVAYRAERFLPLSEINEMELSESGSVILQNP